MRELFAELYGKETGSSGGLSGSMDISSPKDNFFSGAILAGAASIAMGVAMNLKMSNKKGPVIFAGLGDGASEEGVFWETLIIAAYKNYQLYLFAKIIIILLSHPQKKDNLALVSQQGQKSFGTNSCQVFGSDICEIYKRLNNFTNLARKGDGPFFVGNFYL